MERAVSPSTCPTCGEPNSCGMSQGKSECWCFAASIPRHALERIPAEAKDQACICPRCAQASAQPRSQASAEFAPHE